jgi:hypothetical protein
MAGDCGNGIGGRRHGLFFAVVYFSAVLSIAVVAVDLICGVFKIVSLLKRTSQNALWRLRYD